MRVFLCYASNDREVADDIALRLRGDGHKVFVDYKTLPPGSEFDEHIRRELQRAALMVFLISPFSIAPGRYTLTELKQLEEKYPHPAGHLLPVMITPTPVEDIPPYVRALSILEPVGNLAAEVGIAVEHFARRRRRRIGLIAGGSGGLVTAISTAVVVLGGGASANPRAVDASVIAAPLTADAAAPPDAAPPSATDAAAPDGRRRPPRDAAVTKVPAIDARLVDAAPRPRDAGIVFRPRDGGRVALPDGIVRPISVICYQRTGGARGEGSCLGTRCPTGCTELGTAPRHELAARLDRICTVACACPAAVKVCAS